MIKLPEGKRIAVSVGVDFDAHSVWHGTFGSRSEGHLSRGEFGAEVGVPRVLELLQRFDIETTWFIPTHTLLTFPKACESILASGHEVAAHGVYHEAVRKVEPGEPRRLLEMQIDLLQNFTGKKLAGYRSPSWDHTTESLSLLDEYGFVWDSSLMGRDFTPYRPRPIANIDFELGNTFAEPARVIEFPVSWFLDDFPALESIPRAVSMQSTEVLFNRWKDHFDFAYERVSDPVFVLTIHPETMGRAHAYLMLERFLKYMASHQGVWFKSLSDIAAHWRES